jgi:hypothetical protein
MNKEYIESRLEQIDRNLKDYNFMLKIFLYTGEKVELEHVEKLIDAVTKEQKALKKDLRKL